MKTPTLLTGLLLLAACGRDTTPETPAAAPGSQDALTVGWSVRMDDPEEAVEAGRFRQHDRSLEITYGANATVWHDDHTAAGDYRLSVDVTHLDSGIHPHGAGFTFGGSDVHELEQRYTYFMVRCDRNFLIKTRNGENTDVVVNWTEHEAVAAENEKGVMHNHLAVELRGDDVRFLINGKEVHRAPRKSLHADGRYGLRLVHDIHVRFDNFALETL